MSGNSDFVIENGVLKEYNGPGGEVTVPIGVRSLSHRIFADRKDLTLVRIPEEVETIGSSAFRNCTSLKTVALPASVTAIEGWHLTAAVPLWRSDCRILWPMLEILLFLAVHL